MKKAMKKTIIFTLSAFIFVMAAAAAFAQQAPTASTGCVSGNCVNGRGKIVYANIGIYEGNFVNGKKEGQGTFTVTNGDVYTGHFANDSYNGKGKYKYADGSIYEGDFVNSKVYGQGTFTYKDVGVYVGQFANGLRNRQGKFSYLNGDIYEGNWVDDKTQGQGTFTLKNGDYYVGGWLNGKHNGSGKQYSKATNTVWEGIWKDDVFVSSTVAATSPTSSSNGTARRAPTAEELKKAADNMTPELRQKFASVQKSSKVLDDAAEEFLKENPNYKPDEFTQADADANKGKILNKKDYTFEKLDTSLGTQYVIQLELTSKEIDKKFKVFYDVYSKPATNSQRMELLEDIIGVYQKGLDEVEKTEKAKLDFTPEQRKEIAAIKDSYISSLAAFKRMQTRVQEVSPAITKMLADNKAILAGLSDVQNELRTATDPKRRRELFQIAKSATQKALTNTQTVQQQNPNLSDAEKQGVVKVIESLTQRIKQFDVALSQMP